LRYFYPKIDIDTDTDAEHAFKAGASGGSRFSCRNFNATPVQCVLKDARIRNANVRERIFHLKVDSLGDPIRLHGKEIRGD
jgi:hypothetical protein